MPDDTRSLPAIPAPLVSLDDALGSNLPVSLRMMLDERMYEKVKQLAGVMSKAEGFTPKHLMGKAEACFVVISCSLNWKMDPHFVARCTYQTPGGSIGFEGKLVQAIIEQSGRLDGGVEYEWTGDWTKLVGKYQIVTGNSGKPYPKATWTSQDAIGLGVIVRAQLRGERQKRVWPAEGQPFQLTQCFPLNSPLWATDPKTQIAYLAVRRFANQSVPQLLGGMAFDEDELLDASDRARDVTADRLDAHAAGVQEAAQPEPVPWEVFDAAGEVYEFASVERAVEACRKILIRAADSETALETAWENNLPFMNSLPTADAALALERLYAELAPPSPADGEGASPAPDDPAQRPASEDAVSPAPAAGRSHPENPAPGSQNERSATETPVEQRGEGQPPQAEHSVPVAAATLPTQSAERHDPFWDRESLRLDPPERAPGKPDWKVWPALVLPRIRQAWSLNLLTALYQDNADNLDAYASNFGSRPRDELVGEFDQARDRFND